MVLIPRTPQRIKGTREGSDLPKVTQQVLRSWAQSSFLWLEDVLAPLICTKPAASTSVIDQSPCSSDLQVGSCMNENLNNIEAFIKHFMLTLYHLL